MERAAVFIVCTVIQNDERILSCVDANCDVSLRLLKKSACTRSVKMKVRVAYWLLKKTNEKLL